MAASEASERAILYRLLLATGAGSAANRGRGQGVTMSKAEGFRQYAEEAVRCARKSKTEQEKQALMDLARTCLLRVIVRRPDNECD